MQPVFRATGSEPDSRVNRTRRVESSLGAVFTPPRLARELATGFHVGVPEFRRYLDPACGTANLLLAAARSHPKASRLEGLFGIEIQPAFAASSRERLQRTLVRAGRSDVTVEVVCADALDESRRWPEGCAVIANPPWVSYSGRQSAREGSARVPAQRGWPSLQGAFVERIARYVAANGTAARVLLPGSLTELERYGPLRAEVTRWVRVLDGPRELGIDAFPGVIEPAVMLTLVPQLGAARSTSAPWTAEQVDARDLVAALGRFPRLPHKSFADPGVHTGNCSEELISHAPCEGWVPVRQGRDVTPFHLGTARAWLRTDLEPVNGRRFRIGSIEHFRSFPVLLRQTADRPIAAVHDDVGHFRNSVLACRGAPGLDPHFIAAILNGPVAAAWHRARFRDARQRAFPQVKVAHLATQPFPIADRAQAPDVHDRLANLSRAAHCTARRTDSILQELSLSAVRAFGLSLELEARCMKSN